MIEDDRKKRFPFFELNFISTRNYYIRLHDIQTQLTIDIFPSISGRGTNAMLNNSKKSIETIWMKQKRQLCNYNLLA